MSKGFATDAFACLQSKSTMTPHRLYTPLSIVVPLRKTLTWTLSCVYLEPNGVLILLFSYWIISAKWHIIYLTTK